MKIGACQFAVTNDIMYNLSVIKEAVLQAACECIELLVFPECALTGYPTRDIESSSQVDFNALSSAFDEIQYMANEKNMNIIVGAVTREFGKYYNTAVVFYLIRKNLFIIKGLYGDGMKRTSMLEIV